MGGNLLRTASRVKGKAVNGILSIGSLDEDAGAPECYLPLSQLPDKFLPLTAHGAQVAVRTTLSPLAQVSSIHHNLEQFNSQLVMYEAKTTGRTAKGQDERPAGALDSRPRPRESLVCFA